MKMDTPGEHAFKGAPLVFEAIMFERISSLRPSVSQFVDPPIQKYTSQRKSKWLDLAKLGPEMINKCNFCSSRGLDLVEAEDGDVAKDVVEPGAVKENVVEPTDMVENDVERTAMVEIDVEITAENDVESTTLGKNDDEPTVVAENVEPTAAAAKVDDTLENRLATMNMKPKYEKPKRDIKVVNRLTYDETHFNPRKNTGRSAGESGTSVGERGRGRCRGRGRRG